MGLLNIGYGVSVIIFFNYLYVFDGVYYLWFVLFE